MIFLSTELDGSILNVMIQFLWKNKINKTEIINIVDTHGIKRKVKRVFSIKRYVFGVLAHSDHVTSRLHLSKTPKILAAQWTLYSF